MTRFGALAVAIGLAVGGAGAAAAQSFDLGHLGFGLLGGGPGLGFGSSSTETGSTTAAGTAFGTKAEQPGQFTGTLGTATESLIGPEMHATPSRVVPEEIRVGR